MRDKVETIIFSVRWPKVMVERLDRLCEEDDRSRNWMIKKAVAEMLGMVGVVGGSLAEDEGNDV